MPLLFDMPLDQLKSYQGRNPKPADFDTFWDAALKKMRAADPQLELKPAGLKLPFAECFDMYWTGAGGARVYAKLVRPTKAAKPHPAILKFHGYTGNCGDWYDALPFAAMGWTVAMLDCRGQAGKSQDVGGVIGNTHNGHIIRGIDEADPAKMLFHQIYLDTAQMAKIVMDMDDVDETRVAATGGSQGGGLTVACTALEPRIKLSAPMYPFLSDYQRVWEMDQAERAYAELKTYFRHFDPLHEREKEIFTKLGYIDIQHLAPRIRAEVLMAVGFCDTVCPPSTQFAAYNKITSKKQFVGWPDFAHEHLPGWDDIRLKFLIENL